MCSFFGAAQGVVSPLSFYFLPSRSAGADMPSLSKRFQPLDIGVWMSCRSLGIQLTWLLSNGNMSLIWGYDGDMMGIWWGYDGDMMGIELVNWCKLDAYFLVQEDACLKMLMIGPNSWPNIWGKSGFKPPCFDPCPYILWKSNMIYYIMIVENLSFIDVLFFQVWILNCQVCSSQVSRMESWRFETKREGEAGQWDMTDRNSHRNSQPEPEPALPELPWWSKSLPQADLRKFSGQDTQNKRQLSEKSPGIYGLNPMVNDHYPY